MANRPICSEDTPDPWVVQWPPGTGLFYLTFTCGDRVEIWSSPSLENFQGCQKSCVWRPSAGSPWSVDVWAPELHNLHGVWYIYVSGAHPQEGNRSHRTILLRSANPDPMDAGSWQFLGPVGGMPDHWAIDATVFTLQDSLYCCYSGWPLGDDSDTEQDLFLIRLVRPEEADLNTLVRISQPKLDWERLDNRGINEGPQFLRTVDFTGIIYSACGSWTNKYKLGALQLVGQDVLSPNSWRKMQRPVMISDPEGRHGPHGPGHASFVPTSDPSQVYCIYHATGSPTDGWANRKAHVCILGSETFLQNDTIICGASVPQKTSQIGYPAGPQAHIESPAIQGNGPAGASGGPQAHTQTQGRHGFFGKIRDKLREL